MIARTIKIYLGTDVELYNNKSNQTIVISSFIILVRVKGTMYNGTRTRIKSFQRNQPLYMQRLNVNSEVS